MSAPLPGPAFTTAQGIPVFLEASHALPLVEIEILAREGTVLDPPGREGLTRLCAQTMRRGPRGMSAEAFDEAIERLGATFGAGASAHAVRFQGAVIRRNLEPYLRLVGRAIATPALRPADLARQRRKMRAELVEMRDHDGTLAARAMRRRLFAGHPYGRPASGTLDTLDTLTRAEVAAHAASLARAGDLIVGVAGDVRAEELAPLLDRALAGIPAGPALRTEVGPPRLRPGRHVVVVDKPERTQTQLFVGTLGARLAEPAHDALLVATTGFGGTFTSRLVQEVRVARGWSYGAGAKLGADREREAWTMWTHPGASQLLDCLRLELELLEAWAQDGLGEEEVARAVDYLVKSHAFDLETPGKRLDPQLETELHGLPADFHPRYGERVRAVHREAAARAVRARIRPADLTIALVATATPELLASLEALPGVRSVERIEVHAA